MAHVATLVLVACVLAGCMAAERPLPTPSTSVEATTAPVTREALLFGTDLGEITVLLYPEAAPKTVELMKAFTAERYYERREFNRVVPGHVIQLVDKVGGATDDPRRLPLEVTPTHHFSAGAAGIARGSDPNSGGPEFFLMDFATSHLDGNYTVWGQTVAGLDVVHAAARVASVDARPLAGVPVVADYATDRQAVRAPLINSVQLVTVTLPADRAADFPLKVGRNVVAGDHRHSLDYPADLAAGRPADLTWYVRSSNADAPPPAATDVTIEISGDAVRAMGEMTPGIYHWSWTPGSAGPHTATFTVGGTDIASIEVDVRG